MHADVGCSLDIQLGSSTHRVGRRTTFYIRSFNYLSTNGVEVRPVVTAQSAFQNDMLSVSLLTVMHLVEPGVTLERLSD